MIVCEQLGRLHAIVRQEPEQVLHELGAVALALWARGHQHHVRALAPCSIYLQGGRSDRQTGIRFRIVSVQDRFEHNAAGFCFEGLCQKSCSPAFPVLVKVGSRVCPKKSGLARTPSPRAG